MLTQRLVPRLANLLRRLFIGRRQNGALQGFAVELDGAAKILPQGLFEKATLPRLVAPHVEAGEGYHIAVRRRHVDSRVLVRLDDRFPEEFHPSRAGGKTMSW